MSIDLFVVVGPIDEATQSEPRGLPISAVFFHERFGPLAFLTTVNADEGKGDVPQAKADQPPTERRENVVITFRETGLNELDFAVVQANPIVERAGGRIRRLRVRKQDLRGAGFENDITNVGLQNV